jgi:hypothetical protein
VVPQNFSEASDFGKRAFTVRAATKPTHRSNLSNSRDGGRLSRPLMKTWGENVTTQEVLSPDSTRISGSGGDFERGDADLD